MTLSARLWADNSDLAAEALAHPFVCRLSDGSLAREIFASYVAQDAFFLESFARAYADTPTHARGDVTSTLTPDEAADQPAPAVRLATERRSSDGRFAHR